MNEKAITTDRHVFRLQHGQYLTITQDADPGGDGEPHVPAQTVWLEPRDVRKLLDFVQGHGEQPTTQ